MASEKFIIDSLRKNGAVDLIIEKNRYFKGEATVLALQQQVRECVQAVGGLNADNLRFYIKEDDQQVIVTANC